MTSKSSSDRVAVGQDSVSDTLAKAWIAGVACAIISSFLNPLDVTKVRMQNQSDLLSLEQKKYKTVIQSARLLLREEGFAGLMRGVTPSIFRELTYSSVRIGAYEPIRFSLHEATGSSSSPILKFLSALCSGFIGSYIANPFDLIKTRFQALLPHERSVGGKSVTMVGAMASVIRSEGVSGLYKGWQPTTLRAAVVTSAQLGSYDSIKNNLLIDVFHIQNGLQLHILASLAAGLITTTAANPVDVVKTRYLADVDKTYRGPWHCAVVVFKQDGVRGFFKVPTKTRFYYSFSLS